MIQRDFFFKLPITLCFFEPIACNLPSKTTHSDKHDVVCKRPTDTFRQRTHYVHVEQTLAAMFLTNMDNLGQRIHTRHTRHETS